MAISLIIGVPVNGKTFGYFLSLEPRNIGLAHLHVLPYVPTKLSMKSKKQSNL